MSSAICGVASRTSACHTPARPRASEVTMLGRSNSSRISSLSERRAHVAQVLEQSPMLCSMQCSQVMVRMCPQTFMPSSSSLVAASWEISSRSSSQESHAPVTPRAAMNSKAGALCSSISSVSQMSALPLRASSSHETFETAISWAPVRSRASTAAWSAERATAGRMQMTPSGHAASA